MVALTAILAGIRPCSDSGQGGKFDRNESGNFDRNRWQLSSEYAKNEANRVSVRESCLEDYDLGFDS